MPGPELAEDDGDDGDVVGGFDGTEDAEGGSEMEVGTVDLGIGDDDGIVAGFDGVEDEEDDSEESSSSSGGGSTGGGGDIAISAAIENGLAEVACVGLEGRQRERVRGEMKAVASQFKVGYFGEKCVHKYLETDLENIPPEYGLAAALIAFGAIAIYKRPDGEEKVQRAVRTIRDRLSGDDEPEPEPEPAPEPKSAKEEVEESGEDNTETEDDTDE